jgi:glycosyltransferase involved in cell wall biosynthesis
MSLADNIEYSIIICSYNPDDRLLERCLAAVQLLNIGEFRAEIILVDNNSTIPLASLPYVSEFLKKMPYSKLINENIQGLNYARVAGIKASKGAYVVFFDDDNEPESNYLQELQELHQHYSNVGAWGPGNVKVDFVDGIIDPGIEIYEREAFQERQETHVTYANQRTWQSCYPFGTGLCLRKSYLNEYISLAEQGKFSLSDRKGNQLSSGGDTQMVLFCISRGAAAGVSPGLRLTHMIPGKRTNFDYLKRLTYGTSVCYSTCMLEVFPEYKELIEKHLVSRNRFIKKTLKRYFLLQLSFKPKNVLKLISYIGAVSGDYMALKQEIPNRVNWVLKKLKAI